MSDPIVIVGAGQAALAAAEALRNARFEGPISLIGDEPWPPYHRPPLSKAWLAGTLDGAQLQMRAPAALARRGLALHLGVPVTRLNRAAQTVELADGQHLPYAGLLLATGATARPLALPGHDAAGVCVLRSRADADRLAGELARAQASQGQVVVVGGGFIGLEVAASARQRGLAVCVLEAAPRLLGRVLAPLLGDWFAELHRRNGVELVFNAQLSALEVGAPTAESPQGRVQAVHLADGRRIAAALVVVGIGVQANDALALAAGLTCDRGIVVDACARTSDPHIVAAGDCTARRLDDGQLLRLESVQNAVEQGKCAAASLLGQPRASHAAPWFWSDQYAVKLQMAGLSAGAQTHVVRGDLGTTAFSVLHFQDGRLLGADSVNAAQDHLAVRKLLEAARHPTPEQAADPAFDLTKLL